jgi:LPS O-antigen subunit length determinant protein (WzzB/FepE family)
MISLEQLLLGLWRLRGRVLLLAALLFAGGAATVILWPRQYVAEAMVAPAETTGIATSTLLSATPAITGLFDPRPTGNFAIYLGALRSAEAAEMLADGTALLPWLSARRREGPMGWLRAALDIEREADLDDARDWLERRLAVTQTLGAVTWTLALAHPEREMALDLLRRLHGFAEGKVRADLEDLARRRIAALEQRLARESDLYVRQSLYELLAMQQRAGVVVAADEAVAARLVSAPMVELRASQPNRPLLLLLLVVVAPAAALGLVVAGLLWGAATRATAPAPARRPRLEPAE